MTDILKEIQLSRGAFYYHFASKEKCFEECVKHFISTTIDDSAISDSTSLREYMDSYIKKVSIRIQKYPSLDRIAFFSEAVKIVPSVFDYFSTAHQNEIHAWLTVIARAIETHEIKETLPIEEIAKLFIYQCDGLVLNLSVRGVADILDIELKKSWENIYNFLRQ